MASTLSMARLRHDAERVIRTHVPRYRVPGACRSTRSRPWERL
jgi:hypothetical protein